MAVDNLAIANANAYTIRSLHSFEFKPSVMDTLYYSYGQGLKTLALNFIRGIDGRKIMVPNETLTHQEQNFPHRTITVGSSVTLSGVPGGSAIFDMNANDVDSSGNYYPREGFTVQLGDVVNGFIQCYIYDITAGGANALITVYPYDVTKTITATYCATGKEVPVLDSAFATETGQPVATSVGSTERTHYAQIMKETIKFGGQELAKQKWVNVEGIGWFNEELSRGEFLLDLQLEAALIMGQLNTNTSVIKGTSSISGSTSTPIQKNKGVWTWIDELGYDLTYTNAASFTIDDLDTAAEYLESVGVTNDTVLFCMGGSLYTRLENSGVDFVRGTAGGLNVNFTPNGVGGMMLNVGWDTIKKRGITFVPYKLPIFSNPYLFGINDSMLNDAGMMFPISMVKDMKSSMVIPNLYMGYVGLGGYSRERVIGTLGGMDGFGKQMYNFPIVSEIDGNSTYWLSNVMFPFVEAFKGILVKRSS
jgi:hypothetical protein